MGVLHRGGNKKPPGGPNNRRTPYKRCKCSNKKPGENDDKDSVDLMWEEIDRQIDEVSDGFAEMRYYISVAEGKLDEYGGYLVSGITDQIDTMEKKLDLIRSTLDQLRHAQCSDIIEF